VDSKGIIREPICFGCANFLIYPECLAYPGPKGIPADIRGGARHDTLRGDERGGFKYESIRNRVGNSGAVTDPAHLSFGDADDDADAG
jgi:hypothetical protein